MDVPKIIMWAIWQQCHVHLDNPDTRGTSTPKRAVRNAARRVILETVIGSIHHSLEFSVGYETQDDFFQNPAHAFPPSLHTHSLGFFGSFILLDVAKDGNRARIIAG